jgi:hypothetical protein
MKVQATRTGFYNHIRRREGDVFTIPDTPTRKLTEKDKQRIEYDAVKKDVKVKVDGKDVVETHVPAAFGTWMEPVEARAPERVSTAQQAVRKASDEINTARRGGSTPGTAGDERVTGDAEVI